MVVAGNYICLWDKSRQGSACGYPHEVYCTSEPSDVTCQSCNLLSWHLTSKWKASWQANDRALTDRERRMLEEVFRPRSQRMKPWNIRKGPDPRSCGPLECVDCRDLPDYDSRFIYSIRLADGQHRVMGRLPDESWYFDLGGHDALDDASIMADRVLHWQDVDDGDRSWLVTGTFVDWIDPRCCPWGVCRCRHLDNGVVVENPCAKGKHPSGCCCRHLPGIQKFKNAVEEFFQLGFGSGLKSAVFTNEWGSQNLRLHGHAPVVALSSVTKRLLEAWWRGGSYSTVSVSEAKTRDGVVVYVMKYTFKDIFRKEALIMPRRHDGRRGVTWDNAPGMFAHDVDVVTKLADDERAERWKRAGNHLDLRMPGYYPESNFLRQACRTERHLEVFEEMQGLGYRGNEDTELLKEVFRALWTAKDGPRSEAAD